MTDAQIKKSKDTKMPEIIHYAWGKSSLGDFIAAMSDRGLVAFEFSSNRPAMEEALRARFAEADLVEDQAGLAGVVNKLIRTAEEPGTDPGIPLDLRGTPYEIGVWEMLREIPAGETTHYGALAARLGTRDPRDVTAAIANNAVAILVPCHRVIKKDGSISGYRWGFRRKRELLTREQRHTLRRAT